MKWAPFSAASVSGGSLRHSPDVIDVPSPLPQSRAARRVSVMQSHARQSRVSAWRGEAALRPPCGRAQLVTILIMVGTCTRSCARVRVSRQSCAQQSRVSACRSRFAINRSEEIVFDPSSRIDYSINRLIVNNPNCNAHAKLINNIWSTIF